MNTILTILITSALCFTVYALAILSYEIHKVNEFKKRLRKMDVVSLHDLLMSNKLTMPMQKIVTSEIKSKLVREEGI